MECVNLTEWKRTRGIHAQTARRWYRLGTLPVPARNAGRLVLASPRLPPGRPGRPRVLAGTRGSSDPPVTVAPPGTGTGPG